MEKVALAEKSYPDTVINVSLLTVVIVRDNSKFMAKCPELDLITEMDTQEQAFKAIVEMIREYAQDYEAHEEHYLKSPNRAHHKPYIDRIAACQDEWEVMELIGVRYGHIYV